MKPRMARLYHAPALAGILWAFGREADWLPRVRSRRSDLGLLARVITRGWVRQIGDRRGPAAFIARDGERIHALYVHPRARRRGAARALVNEAKAESARLELWATEANEPARAFYRAQGFAEVARSDGRGSDEKLAEILYVWESEAVNG